MAIKTLNILCFFSSALVYFYIMLYAGLARILVHARRLKEICGLLYALLPPEIFSCLRFLFFWPLSISRCELVFRAAILIERRLGKEKNEGSWD